MKKVSTAYKQAMNKSLRNRSYMIVTVGVISNEAQASAKVVSQGSYLSDNNTLFRDTDISTNYATLEANVFKLDGSMLFAPEQSGYEQLVNDMSYVSADIGGNLIVRFDKAYNIKGLTINFGEFYPTEFTVNGNTYTNDSALFTCDDSFSNVSSLTITPIHFVGGDNKRLRVNSVLMGIGIVFQNEDIESASFTDSASFISEELPQLDFNITCFDRYKRFNVDDSNSFINYLETGQKVQTSIGIELDDSSIEFVNLPLTYLYSWSSNNEKVAFTSVDRFAFLTNKYTNGNTVHTRTLYNEAVAVLTDAGLEPDEYEISDFLRTIEIINPMPEVTHAEALQLIANASGCALKQGVDGIISFIPNFENILEPDNITLNTSSQMYWAKPDNVKQGSEVVYADLTNNFFKMDGSTLFIPTPNELSLIQDSGFVANPISNSAGYFDTSEMPSVTLILPTAYTYYGVNLNFINPMLEFRVDVLKLTETGANALNTAIVLDSFTVTSDDPEGQTYFEITHDLENFDALRFIFLRTAIAHQHVVLQKVSFGDLSDYKLKKENMSENPIGTVEPKVQSVGIRVFTFDDSGDKPKPIDDNVFEYHTINPTGSIVKYENQLISRQSHAELIAKWIANYYANNVTYDVVYRGEPRLDSSDYIFIDSDIINNLQVEIESHTIEFGNGIKGNLKLRRASKVVNSN